MAFFLQLMGTVPPDPHFLGGGFAPHPEPTLNKYSVLGFLKVGSYVYILFTYIFNMTQYLHYLHSQSCNQALIFQGV